MYSCKVIIQGYYLAMKGHHVNVNCQWKVNLFTNCQGNVIIKAYVLAGNRYNNSVNPKT